MLQNNEDSQQSAISTHSKDLDDDDDDSEQDRQQWGNFEDEPHSSTSKPVLKAPKRKLITAGERDLLKEEFIGIMYSNFLSGKDAEHYDYATVDNNEDYDNTLETDQDCEDRYFEEDPEEYIAQQTIDDDSEDELDIYMKHLENNLKQQENGFEKEFD